MLQIPIHIPYLDSTPDKSFIGFGEHPILSKLIDCEIQGTLNRFCFGLGLQSSLSALNLHYIQLKMFVHSISRGCHFSVPSLGSAYHWMYMESMIMYIQLPHRMLMLRWRLPCSPAMP